MFKRVKYNSIPNLIIYEGKFKLDDNRHLLIRIGLGQENFDIEPPIDIEIRIFDSVNSKSLFFKTEDLDFISFLLPEDCFVEVKKVIKLK